MYNFLVGLHGGLRWLVVLVAIVAIIKYTLGMVQKGEWQKNDRILMAAFAGMVDLNVLIGIILLLWRGIQESYWARERLEHGVTMLIVIAILHATAKWRRAGTDAMQFRNHLIVVVGTMLLIVAGVFVIGGWNFSS